jgi:large subunit ribosomal protein L25
MGGEDEIAMADVQLSVDPRVVTGKKVKALRRQGITPAHLYGRDTESLAVQASTQTVINLLRTAGGNAIIDLHINGESKPRPVVLRGVQRHPVSGELVHVDFYQISLTETLRSEVPLVLTGESPAVSVYDGVLLQNLDRVTVEALPSDVPQQIEVDVSGLEEIDSAIFLRDLDVPPNVQVLADLDQVVAKIAAPRLAVELEEEVAEEEEGVEGEEGAEDAEAAEGEADGEQEGEQAKDK